MFNQQGQSVGIQININTAIDVFRRHRDRYQSQLDKAVAENDTYKAGLLAARLSALKAFAAEIGIEES